VNKFKNIIQNEIDAFHIQFATTLSTKASLLHKVANYVNKNNGKQVRPIIVLIAAGLLNNLNKKSYRGAILIELLHTATLIHDDIVDDAHLRRSKLSINTIWKNKIGVLAGDYFLAKGLSLASQYKDYDILEIISNVVEKIVEGELIQINKTKQLNLNEKDYFNIIELKTASLFEASFKIGAITANASHEEIDNLSKLGLIIGRLFQLQDDILDYNTSSISGKKYGNDIKEGKINLPLLYTLKKVNLIEKRIILNTLRSTLNRKQDIIKVIKLVTKYKGIDYVQRRIKIDYNLALESLIPFPNNKYKTAIKLLLSFIVTRNK
tara:strand:+ start:1633 stop:2598 length:966 start_codon:yes stop_codon:yes gene_type:complete